AMEKRLDATLAAVKIVQPALAKFYNSLNDEQKARFNSLRSASRSAGWRRQAIELARQPMGLHRHVLALDGAGFEAVGLRSRKHGASKKGARTGRPRSHYLARARSRITRSPRRRARVGQAKSESSVHTVAQGALEAV